MEVGLKEASLESRGPGWRLELGIHVRGDGGPAEGGGKGVERSGYSTKGLWR